MANGAGARVVNVGEGGRFSRKGSVASSRQDIDALFLELDRVRTDRVLFFFHGGLVKQEVGAASAQALAATLRSAGVEPLFFVWETGALEILGRNVCAVLSTELFRKLAGLVLRRLWSRLSMGSLSAKGAEAFASDTIAPGLRDGRSLDSVAVEATRPPSEFAQRLLKATLLAELEHDVAMESMRLEATLLMTDKELAPILQESVYQQIHAKGPWFAAIAVPLATAAFQILKRFWYKRDHGLQATIVEELLRSLYVAAIGRELWVAMKETAEAMWASNETVALDADIHAGSYVLDKLAAHCARHRGFSVDVVAHSAGAIATCHLVRTMALRHTDLRLRDVALLAPACEVRLFADSILAQRRRVARARVFALNDAAERADAINVALYPRSILYLVSGALEQERDAPLLGMARHVSGFKPYDESPLPDVARLLRTDPAISWVDVPTAEDAPLGARSSACHHAAFAEDPATLGSIVSMLKEG